MVLIMLPEMGCLCNTHSLWMLQKWHILSSYDKTLALKQDYGAFLVTPLHIFDCHVKNVHYYQISICNNESTLYRMTLVYFLKQCCWNWLLVAPERTRTPIVSVKKVVFSANFFPHFFKHAWVSCISSWPFKENYKTVKLQTFDRYLV